MIVVPAARPSRPSVRLTPFAAPATTRYTSTYQPTPSSTWKSSSGTYTRVETPVWWATSASSATTGTSSTSFQRPGEPERPALDDLREVIDEADACAQQRDGQHAERLVRAVGEGEERDRRHRDDEDAAHRRGALLRLVAGRALLADVLAEAARVQEADEPPADDDRQHGCDHAGREHLAHEAASTRRSRPTLRDALSSTTSPGCSRAGRPSAAASTSANQTLSAPSR